MMMYITTERASQKSVEEVYHTLEVDVERGLSHAEAERRRRICGRNDFDHVDSEPIWKKYLEQFKNPLILLLLASAVVSLCLRNIDDAVSISVAIVIVVTVGFVQEYRSEKSLEALKRLVPPRCTCLREGRLESFYASELVPGDVIVLTAGDRVPADLRLFEALELLVDESSFTGECEPVSKQCAAIPAARSASVSSSGGPPGVLPVNSVSASRSNIVLMGTLVRSGSARGITIATGMNTEFGEVYAAMSAEESPKTPLQRSMDALGKQLSAYSILVIVLISLLGVLEHRNWLELFTIGVSLGVAAIPEGLPIVVTVTLAIGVMRMAKRNAIVKKLPAVETLGCVDIVCSDKTGTLTTNEMTATRVVTSDGLVAEVSGTGYNADGVVTVDGVTIPRAGSGNGRNAGAYASLYRLGEVASVCNNAQLEETGGELRGQPTDGALLALASKLGVASSARSEYNRLQEWPFSSETKTMIVRCGTPNSNANLARPSSTSTNHMFQVQHAGGDIQNAYGLATSPNRAAGPTEIFFVKGAFERVLKLCKRYNQNGVAQVLTPKQESSIMCEATVMGRLGLRVIGLAEGPSREDLCFLGMVGIIDPPRPGALEAIKALQRSGVQVKMITGDAEETACAIGAQLGIYSPGSATMSGDELERLDIAHLRNLIENVSVLYRTTPRHKSKIIKALQANGHIVAMTGDGVNDAVALKCADIGIAMGRGGTDVSREAAAMILTDDHLQTIVAAIEEGRAIFLNIRNFVRFQLSTSIAALSLITVASVCRLPSPLNAMQILWINIIMDGPPAQSLGVEPIDHDVLKQPPRSATDRILNRHLLGNVLLSALVIVSGTSLVFWYELKDYHVNARDTTLTFTAFVLFDMFNALSCRSQTKSIFRVGFTTNRMFLIAVGLSLLAQLLVIYAPPLQAVFVTEPLSLSDLMMLVGLTSSVFIVSEIKKYIENRMRWNGEHISTKRKTKKSIISRIFKSKNRSDMERLPEDVV